MPSLPLDRVKPDHRSIATYAAAIVFALAREERRGRRPLRLLEPGLATWERFRGRLGAGALIELVLEDAAVSQPLPFDVPRTLTVAGLSDDDRTHALRNLPDELFAQWLELLPQANLEMSGEDYIREQARVLGLPTRLARAELHRIKPHQRVLELPGTGGQLAHHVVTQQQDIHLQDVFALACGDWREFALAGLVCVELGLTGEQPVIHDPDLSRHRSGGVKFDQVIGLDPDKGGAFLKTWVHDKLLKEDGTVQLV